MSESSNPCRINITDFTGTIGEAALSLSWKDILRQYLSAENPDETIISEAVLSVGRERSSESRAIRTSEGDRVAAMILAFGLVVLSLERPQLPTERPTWGLLFSNNELAVHAIDAVRAATWLVALAFLGRSAHREISARRGVAA